MRTIAIIWLVLAALACYFSNLKAAPAPRDWITEPTAAQLAAAKEAYAKHGASYRCYTDPRTKQTTHLFIMPDEATDANLKDLPDLPFRFALILGGTGELSHLKLSNDSEVTDAGLNELKELKNLTELSLFNTNVTDAGLKELKDLKNLVRLDLGSTSIIGIEVNGAPLKHSRVTGAGLTELKDLKKLSELSLFNTKVTDAGLKEIKELKNLTELNLGATYVTDVGMKDLKELRSLTTLDLSYTKVTDAGLKDLKELRNLTTLDLSYTQVTGAELKELGTLKLLRTLNLCNTKVTGVAIAELKSALPGCKIKRYGSLAEFWRTLRMEFFSPFPGR